MVKSVKRERTGSEEPMLPLTPESSNDRGDGKRSGSAGNDDKDASPFSPSPRKRVKQNKAAASRSKATSSQGKRSTVPTCYEETTEADKYLLKLKDEEDRPWNDIHSAMEEFLGCEANKNSLKSRYRNLKANLTVMPECDQKLLLASKEIVEERLEKEKWNMIAEEMQKHGGGKYFGTAVEKQFKKLMKSGQSLLKKASLDEDSD